jgi:hypothetical protein
MEKAELSEQLPQAVSSPAGLKMAFALCANSGGLSKHGVLRYAQKSKLNSA